MIDDKQAITFSNEHLRTFADTYIGAYQKAKQIQIKWLAEGMDQKIPNVEEDINDGAQVDGRTVVTAADARAIKAQVDALINLMESDSMVKLIELTKYAVNPK